jgi:1-acyl-sn-glycerol-3-phosphate acyltransferase
VDPEEKMPGARETAPVSEHAQVATADLAAPPIELLDPIERRTFRAMELLARGARPAVDTFLTTVGQAWVWGGIGNVLEVHGLERLASVPGDAGVLLVSNHRSFFDLYILSAILYRRSHLRHGIFCPVRADFFYRTPLGIVVNMLAAAGRMYPPLFREGGDKVEWNRWAMAETARILDGGRVLVGMHPEGQRNKGDDPYTSLPAKPGTGRLVMDTWPVVVPAFINGLGNDIVREVRDNFRRKQRVIAVFGEPLDLSPWRGLPHTAASHKRIADELLARCYELGAEERAVRAGPRPL